MYCRIEQNLSEPKNKAYICIIRIVANLRKMCMQNKFDIKQNISDTSMICTAQCEYNRCAGKVFVFVFRVVFKSIHVHVHSHVYVRVHAHIHCHGRVHFSFSTSFIIMYI
jgi:hypothetical protein